HTIVAAPLSHAHAHARRSHSLPTRRSSDLRVTNTTSIIMNDDIDRSAANAPNADHIDNHHLRMVRNRLENEMNFPPSVHVVRQRSEEHTSELQSRFDLVCRLLLENKICIRS